MQYLFRITAILLILLNSVTLNANEPKKTALLLEINSAIGPATQDFIHRGIVTAIRQQAAIIILQIDTPGGLGKSMRNIISDILAAPIPIVTYVAPSGARAASAGTFILYASHIAAMAPGTNLGAATPVAVGVGSAFEKPSKEKTPNAEELKTLNDAKAYIRSLAQLRGRNIEWAEQAVSQAASLSANEALKIGVIDVIASDVPDLLQKINGRKVTLQNQVQTLNTTDLAIQTLQHNWRIKFLEIITDPNIAYILLMIGIWGLLFEFSSPGFILPGVVGTICLLLALYAFQLLPINYVGLGLILLAIIFFVAEAFVTSFGVLAVGAVIALIIGSIMLLEPGTTGYHIAMPLILGVSAATAAFFILIINLALKSRFRPVVSGREELLGSVGNVVLDGKNNPRVRIRGELWQVKSKMPLIAGQRVRVMKVEGLTLLVEPVEKNNNVS